MLERAVATASDANYFVGLQAMVRSLRAHEPDLPVFVFDGGLLPDQRAWVRSEGCELATPKIVVGPVFGHVNRTTYARFSSCFLPAKKVLYLDSDVLVVGYLSEIFDNDCPLAVCREDGFLVQSQFHHNVPLTHYGISPDEQAFNAGVFLLDVSYWGKRFYDEYVQKSARWGDAFRFADQSCLIIIAYEHREFGLLPKKWNTFHYELNKYPDFRIVHFHMRSKPWQVGFEQCDAMNLWYQYRADNSK